MPQRSIILGKQRVKLFIIAERLTKSAEIDQFPYRRTQVEMTRSAAGA
jgi:hypothetical protein